MPAPSANPAVLTPLRKEIETLDRRIVALLNKRLEVSTRIGAMKREQKTHNHSFDANREESLLRLLIGENPGPLSAASLRAIYREIFSSSRARQSPLTIGYLDGDGTHDECDHHTPLLAACSRFGVEEHYRAVPRPQALIRETASGRLTLSLFCPESLLASGEAIAKDLYVCGEIVLSPAIPLGKGKGKGKADAKTQKAELPFFLLTRRESEPASTALLPGTRLLFLATRLGQAKTSTAKLAAWCRARRARLLIQKNGAALVSLEIGTKGAAPAPLPQLEESLRAALVGSPLSSKKSNAPRLLLLGAYLAEETVTPA